MTAGRVLGYASSLAGIGGLAVVLWWGFLRTTQVIDTTTIGVGDVESSVSAVGTLQPRSYVDVGAQVSGQIRRIAVQPGTVVKKGDLLIEIDPSIQQSTVDANRAQLAALKAQLADQQAQKDLAELQLARQQRLIEKGYTKLEDVQAAEATLRSAKAKMDNLRAQIDGAASTLKGNAALLGYTRIFAPMAGTVVSLDARVGQTLNATYQAPTLLRIADLSVMTVWAEVSEADVQRVKPGMPVHFSTLGTDARRRTAKVRQVLPSRSASPVQLSGAVTGPPRPNAAVFYTVLFDVDNADADLLPQMSAQVFFVAATASNVVVAPLASLHPVEGKPGVYTADVLEGGAIVQREVRTGVRDRLKAEVVSGLKAGDRLVTGVRREQGAAGRFRW
jgi:macrolide-specific efflux system membrane fusion protein